jgi:hypothetical protein
MPWNARPGCPKYHVAALERLINSHPVEWLLEPQTGEEFDSLEHCNRRLRTFALAKGFDIVLPLRITPSIRLTLQASPPPGLPGQYGYTKESRSSSMVAERTCGALARLAA